MNTKEGIYLLSMEDLRMIMNECFSLAKNSLSQSLPQERENKKDELLSTNEVIARLKITRKTLWEWAKNEYLVPIKVGKKKNYYKVSDIIKIENNG